MLLNNYHEEVDDHVDMVFDHLKSHLNHMVQHLATNPLNAEAQRMDVSDMIFQCHEMQINVCHVAQLVLQQSTEMDEIAREPAPAVVFYFPQIIFLTIPEV